VTNPQSLLVIINPQSLPSAVTNPQSLLAIVNPQSLQSAITNPQSLKSAIPNRQSAIDYEHVRPSSPAFRIFAARRRVPD
ncbi:MAG: hypothetical protein ACJ731_13095, partial [Vicinamibacterales bacterium]